MRWLHLHDVAKLDSAVCSTHHRETFLILLHDEYCVFDYPAKKLNCKHFWWLMRRNVKVSSVHLIDKMFSWHRINLLGATGKSLRTLVTSTVSIDNMSSIVFEISTMCTNLEKLVFTGNNLSQNDICSILCYLPRLQHLDLSYCTNMTCEMLANICSQPKSLCTLELTYSRIIEGGQHVSTYSENHIIQNIIILHCNWASTFLSFALQCKALHTLYMSDIQLTDVFSVLTHCPALTTLSAGVRSSESQYISDEEVTTLISLVQNLEVLHLFHRFSYHWQDGQLERLIKGVSNLCALFTARIDGHPHKLINNALSNKYRLSTECATRSDNKLCTYDTGTSSNQLHTLQVDEIISTKLQSLLQCCTQLQSLTIIYLYVTTEEGDDCVRNLMTTISNSSIRILDISNCRSLRSAATLPLHNLVSISFNQIVHLQQSELIVLLKQNPTLKKLSLIHCKSLSQQSLLAIIEQCPGLEELVFDNTCDSITMSMTLVTGLIKLLRPNLLLTLQLRPE